MTDRFNYLTVVLEKDTREDDAEHLINAIRLLRGVANVKGNVVNPDDWVAAETAKHELRKKIWDLFK